MLDSAQQQQVISTTTGSTTKPLPIITNVFEIGIFFLAFVSDKVALVILLILTTYGLSGRLDMLFLLAGFSLILKIFVHFMSNIKIQLESREIDHISRVMGNSKWMHNGDLNLVDDLSRTIKFFSLCRNFILNILQFTVLVSAFLTTNYITALATSKIEYAQQNVPLVIIAIFFIFVFAYIMAFKTNIEIN
jgi:hypothetical protein